MFNYFSFKKHIGNLGHTITPGNKDGVEHPYVTIGEITFLKRGFKFVSNRWEAPLITRSIESPLVWTQIDDCEIIEWRELIKELLIEACLHGKTYYDEFRHKLRFGVVEEVQHEVSKVIKATYEETYRIYIERYYG